MPTLAMVSVMPVSVSILMATAMVVPVMAMMVPVMMVPMRRPVRTVTLVVLAPMMLVLVVARVLLSALFRRRIDQLLLVK